MQKCGVRTRISYITFPNRKNKTTQDVVVPVINREHRAALQLQRRKNRRALKSTTISFPSTAMPQSTLPQNHYQVLSLPTNPSETKDLTTQDIRLAYRRALLLHHPDKIRPIAQSSSSSSALTPPTTSIDAITLAYKTLINPTSRSEYDRSLLLLTTTVTNKTSLSSHPGLETVDLDAMAYDEKEEMWYRGCRCGRGGMYVVTEEELELNAEYGETITPCQGCSLWLRVTYAVVLSE